MWLDQANPNLYWKLFTYHFVLYFLAYRKCIADDIHCGPPVNADGATIPGTSGGRIADPCVPKEKKCDGKVEVTFLTL
jgi:hypothetical protein